MNNVINSYPVFPGQEKHLLKAQITRISCATVLTSKGLFKQKDESKDIEFEEEYNFSKDYNELKGLGYWVHLHPALCKLGRCSHYANPDLAAEEKEALLAKLGEEDPEIERLKGIEEEKSPFAIAEVFN